MGNGAMFKKLSFSFFLLSVNTACTVSLGPVSSWQQETTPAPLPPATILVLADGFIINDLPLVNDEEIQLGPGKVEVTFSGRVLRPIQIKTEMSKSEQNIAALKFIGCLSVLPLCALVHSARDAKQEPDISYIPADCESNTTFDSEPGGTYVVEMKKNINNSPLLLIRRTSWPANILVEQLMTCDDVEV